MAAGNVPTANINALYSNTTAGTDADPAAVDNAIQDIVTTINDNHSKQVNDMSAHAGAAVLPHPDGSVVESKLATGSVGTAKIKDGNVTTEKIADGSLTTPKIADANVTNPKLATGSVTSDKIATGSITPDKIANLSFTAANFVPGALTNDTQNALRITSLEDETRLNFNKTKLDSFGGFAAHRGLQSRAPENTLKAIAEAGRIGYALVELDPRITSDGVFVLMHDDTVDRTTDGTGTVSSMTLAQIQALTIDTGIRDTDEVFRVPTLDEALQECAYWGLGVNIDGSKFTMNQANIVSIAGLLDAYNLANKSFFVCPTLTDRLAVRQYAQRNKVAWISTVGNADNDIAEAANYNNNALVGYTASTVTTTAISKLNNAGIDIYVYSANDIESVYKWIKKGVRFVETDFILPGGVY